MGDFVELGLVVQSATVELILVVQSATKYDRTGSPKLTPHGLELVRELHDGVLACGRAGLNEG